MKNMKKVLTLSALVTISFLFSRCASTGPVAKSEATPQNMVAEVKKNYTAAQMEQGKTIWQSHCHKCHKLYTPDSHSVTTWNNVLPRMTKRAHLDDNEAGMVRAYLIANATDMG
jgi:cytochrome c5